MAVKTKWLILIWLEFQKYTGHAKWSYKVCVEEHKLRLTISYIWRKFKKENFDWIYSVFYIFLDNLLLKQQIVLQPKIDF